MRDHDTDAAATRARFERLIAQPEADIDLVRGALAIAAHGRPNADVNRPLVVLEDLAERVRLRLDVGDAQTHVIDRLHDVVYREAGFRGPSAAEFHDPRLSLLDVVVERRIGLPINLAIVELDVAWRIGLGLSGIGLPGHFIIGAPGGVLIDPAGAGRRLTPDDCQALIRRSIGEGVLFHAGMLRTASKREILTRVLRNLRAAQLAARDWRAALGTIELLAVAEPTDPEHGRDRGLLLGRMGRFGDAVATLTRYLDDRPDADDAADVRQLMGIFAGRRN
ncbi:MAG TPA: transglutaminase-like domain-containing protein [Candidatus Limnocylindrales bacterium]|nr:transglutaminase-like domain-containing protein [Candidatus Limnocylindrales bacterium]